MERVFLIIMYNAYVREKNIGIYMLEKKCTSCKILKKSFEFDKNKITKSGLASQCKACTSHNKTVNTQEKKRKLVNELGGSCQKCGYNKCIAALDFHHKDNNKEANISSLRNCKYSTMLEEAKKCLLLCSNCHRELHYMEYKRRATKKELSHGTSGGYSKCGPKKCEECKEYKRKAMHKYRNSLGMLRKG
jgi:hypothetical protein